MKNNFLIGDFYFSLSYPEEISPPPNFMKFETERDCSEYSYSIQLTDSLPEPKGKLITRRADIEIYDNEGLENRLLGVKGRSEYYAYYEEISPNEAAIYLNRSGIKDLHIDPVFTSLLSLERRLSKKDALILHCAYVEYEGKAILFSAPSETGKTTQANLWEKYRGSRTVNGDKALLQRLDGQWTAQGWPVCGTSEICYNEKTPVGAIVMLSQGKENTVKKLGALQSFSQLYSQITVNTWNKGFVENNMGLIGQLTGEVPVFHLSCTISEDAVVCLEKALAEVLS